MKKSGGKSNLNKKYIYPIIFLIAIVVIGFIAFNDYRKSSGIQFSPSPSPSGSPSKSPSSTPSLIQLPSLSKYDFYPTDGVASNLELTFRNIGMRLGVSNYDIDRNGIITIDDFYLLIKIYDGIKDLSTGGPSVSECPITKGIEIYYFGDSDTKTIYDSNAVSNTMSVAKTQALERCKEQRDNKKREADEQHEGNKILCETNPNPECKLDSENYEIGCYVHQCQVTAYTSGRYPMETDYFYDQTGAQTGSIAGLPPNSRTYTGPPPAKWEIRCNAHGYFSWLPEACKEV